MQEAVIVDAVRTPMGRGKPGGALSALHPAQILATVLKALVERNALDQAEVDDVIIGCVMQAGEQAQNPARNAWLGAGYPESVPGTTIDRQCGSGQQAVHFAAQGIMAGAYDIVIAGGVESMSRVPMGSARGDRDPFGPAYCERYAPGQVHQGISAELVAARFGLDRETLDTYAARSHQLAAAAQAEGAFAREIVPVAIDNVLRETDETIRPDTTQATLAQLKPSFVDGAIGRRFPEIRWSIHAGNASQITDGAAALLLMSARAAARLGLRPRARFAGFDVVGDDPIAMLTAPIPATKRILKKSGLALADIDHFEVNEAFAPVPLAWLKATGADPERLNPCGGAIALGHPLGASGARLMTTMLNALERRGGRYGLQTMCEGGGMANATVIERI